jgi:hypothetical protein
MLRIRKNVFGPVLAALVLVASARAFAQEPVVVLSVKSVDALVADVKYVLSTAGQEGDLIDGLVEQLTQGKGFAGIDRSKPIGAYVTLDSAQTPSFVIFIPVNDNNAFRDLLATIGFSRQQEAAGGMFSIQNEEQQFFGKFANGHCFLTLLPRALDKLPDPAKIASSKYTLGIEANFAKIPDEVKDGLLEQAEAAVAAAEEGQEPPADELQARLRGRAQKMMLEFVRMIFKESDRMSIGLDVDHKAKLVALDLNLTPKNGTPLAASLANYQNTKPAFASIAGTDAAGSLNFAMPLSDSMREFFRDSIKSSMDQARADVDKSEKLQTAEQKKIVKDLLARVEKVIEATGDTGKVDGTIVINVASDGKAQVVAAGSIAQGDELAKIIDDAVKQNAGQPGFEKFKLDVAKHGGARIHSFEPELKGENKDNISPGPGHLAIRSDAVYLAVGGDSLAAVKAAIDKTGKNSTTRPPASVRALPSKLVAMFGKGDEPNAQLAREAFTGEGDHMSLELHSVERGARLRLELGEGFLRFIALSVSQQLGG